MLLFPPLSWKSMVALAVFVLGVWIGYQWKSGAIAQAQIQGQIAQAKRLQAEQETADKAATDHAQQVKTLNQQLGAAYARIAQLDRRDCLDPGTVGVLNAIGPDLSAPAGQPSDQASAPAANSGHGLAFSTGRDLATQIAVCRAAYGELASQLNSILDIEDARHPQKP